LVVSEAGVNPSLYTWDNVLIGQLPGRNLRVLTGTITIKALKQATGEPFTTVVSLANVGAASNRSWAKLSIWEVLPFCILLIRLASEAILTDW